MRTRHILLLVLVLVEFISMIVFIVLSRKNNPKRMFNLIGRVRFLVIIAFLAVLALTIWYLLFPPMKPVTPSGTYEVGEIDEYFIDSSRTEIYTKDGSKRELPATFWYPKNYTEDRKCPLVLFSHGGMGVRTSNLTLYRELASRGYVVCSIDHPYHCFSTILSNGKKVRVSMKFINETMKDEPSKNPKQSLKHFSSWMNLRTQDINYVLDTIIQNVQEQISNNDSTKINDIYQLIDCSKICVMGHSLGGCAALGIGRQRNDVRAVIALESAFMCDIKDIDEQNHFVFETSDYPIPVLNIYSDSSWSHLNEWPQYEENYRLLQIESSTVKNVHISGTGHFGLTDLSMTTPFITALMDGGMENKPQDTLKRINEECMAFLDSVLK